MVTAVAALVVSYLDTRESSDGPSKDLHQKCQETENWRKT